MSRLGRVLLFALSLGFTNCATLFPTSDDVSETTPASPPTAKPNEGSQLALKILPEETKGRNRKRVYVLPFLNKSRHGGDELAGHARDIVYNSLLGANEYAVVQPAEVENTDGFIDDLGNYNFRTIFDKMRALNISGVVGGTIEDLIVRETGDETGLFRSKQFAVVAKLKIKLFDASTERELMARTTQADVTEERTEFFNSRQITNYDPERGKVAVQKALEKVVGEIPGYAKKIAWNGRIAKIDMHRYYITAGEMSGISKGQLLKVFEEGHAVFDPDSKQLVGVAPGRFKGLLKVVDHFGDDGSVAVIHSGGGFREKDRVEIFTSLQN